MFNLCFRSIAIALGLILTAFVAPHAQASPITYGFTFNGTLNNANGTFGGDLTVAPSQVLNLTVKYTYDDTPQNVTATEATFFLTKLQIIDNTNGLSSDLIMIAPGASSMTLRYNMPLDTIGGVVFGGAPAGGFVLLVLPPPGGPTPPGFMGEFGDPGDRLPGGGAFDQLINGLFQVQLIARGFNADDNIGFGGTGQTVNPGSIQLTSVVPEPTTVSLVAFSLMGLAAVRRRKALKPARNCLSGPGLE